MSDVKQIGVVGNAIHTSQLPEANSFTYGDGNRFYTLENAQDGYIVGHTYRTVYRDGAFMWVDVDDYGATDIDGTAVVNYLARSLPHTINDKNGIVGTLYGGSLYAQDITEAYFPNVSIIGESFRYSYSDIVSNGFTFAYCSSLKKITMPNLLSAKGARNFANCSALESVSFPYVSYFADGTFYGCRNLSYAYLPNLTNVNNSCFQGCYSLKTLVAGEFSYVTSCAFMYCSALQSFKFASDVSIAVQSSAFYGAGLTDGIYISTTQRLTLYGSAFAYTDAPEINITASAITWYSSCFAGCSASNVVLKNTSETGTFGIGNAGFYGCPNLKWGSLSDAPIATLYTNAFYKCSALDYAYLPKLKTFDGGYVFADCSQLKYVYAPKLSLIGSKASFLFNGARYLSSFYIMQESGLTEADVPVASIGNFMSYAGSYVGSTKIYVGYEEYLPWLQSATNWATYSSLMSVSLFVNPDETT